MAVINILVAWKSGRRTFEHSLVVLLFEKLAYMHCLTQETTYQIFSTLKQSAKQLPYRGWLVLQALVQRFSLIIAFHLTLSGHPIHFAFTHLLFCYSATNHSSFIH